MIIKEAEGFESNIGSWNLVNHNTGDLLASGSGAGTINFDTVSLEKINFEITGSSGTPAVAEFETYAGSSADTDTGTDTDTNTDTEIDTNATIVSSADELVSAIESAEAGSTIYIRGGTYYFGETITLEQSGSEESTISLRKYPDDDERPLLDFSAMSESSSNRGLELQGDYWYIYGIDVTQAGDNCLYITGSNNVVEFSTFYECADTGVQLAKGASDNFIKNVDSYYNAIAHDNGRNINFSSSNPASKLTIKNTISMGATYSLNASSTDIEANSWQDDLSATESDFTSVDIDELLQPRKADGSLPDVEYFQLVDDSDLIDAGVDVGLPYNGSAPDIGAFESN